jgi:hypothetical protein
MRVMVVSLNTSVAAWPQPGKFQRGLFAFDPRSELPSPVAGRSAATAHLDGGRHPGGRNVGRPKADR